MIKSKIDARERALELAVEFCKDQTANDELVVRCAESFKSFLIGSAELPEVTDDNTHIKELLEIANKSFDNSRKCNNYSLDDIENFPHKRGIEQLAKWKAELKKD